MTMSLKISESISNAMRELDTRLRRKIMSQVGKESAKILLPQIKTQVPVRTGWLRKVMASKVKVYASGTKVWSGAGPKSGFKILVAKTTNKKGVSRFVTVAKLQYQRGRLVRSTTPKSGGGLDAATMLIWPSKYAHLAGPGRRAKFVEDTVRLTVGRVRAAMAQALIDNFNKFNPGK